MVEVLVQSLAAGAYALTALVMLVLIRRQPAAVRRYSYVVLGVVVVSAAGVALQAFDVGTYQGAVEQPLSIPQFVDDSIAYGVLFGLMTFFSGTSRRMVVLVAFLSFGSRLAIEIGGFLGGGILLLGLLASLGSFFTRVYLLWWPVWRTAKRQHAQRRLLFWKARNALVFLIGVNIIAGIVTGIGLTDRFVQIIVLTYIDFCIRIGFAGFVLSNITALVE